MRDWINLVETELREARTEELQGMLKAFKANPLVKQALGKGTAPDEMALLEVLKSFMENPSFRDYITNTVWSYHVQMLERDPANMRPGDIIDVARDFASKLARGVRGKLSAFTRKALINWCNSDTSTGRHLSDDMIKELMALDVRPSEPVGLYRGMMWGKWALDPTKKDHPHSAFKFIEQLRAGNTSFQITTAKPTSWSVSPDTAGKFASKRAATSQAGAMMNWIQGAGRHIDGELGLIFSGEFQPAQIIVDLGKIDLGHLVHGTEGEMIIAPGLHHIKVERILTPTGVVDVKDFAL